MMSVFVSYIHFVVGLRLGRVYATENRPDYTKAGDPCLSPVLQLVITSSASVPACLHPIPPSRLFFSLASSTMASTFSLPVIKDLSECADFSLTVQPYIHQLYSLPSQVASIASSDSKLDALSAIYLNTNPLITGLFISLALAPIFLVLSEINRNYSQVDRLWSILPGAYVAHFAAFAHLNGLPTQKLDNVLVFSTMWGARLTYNFWRKGGYQIGNEDYRWEIIKARIGPVGMFVMNVVFISTIQSVRIACFLAGMTKY